MNDWQRAAFQYMQDNIEDNRDKITGEINATMLAEDCLWDAFNIAFEIASAAIELGARRMTEAKMWIEDYT